MKHPTLKPTEIRDVLHRFGVARASLRMSQWDVVLMDDYPEDEDAIASVEYQQNHYCFQLRINGEHWRTQSEASKRDTVTHEWIHVMHRTVTELCERITLGDTEKGQTLKAEQYNVYYLEMERFVSHLAGLLEGTVDWGMKDPDMRGIRCRGGG